MDTPIESPALLSLCPGMLALERGLERAIGSVRTIAYVEIEAFIIENMVQQMEQGVLAPAPIFSDIKRFVSTARKLRRKVDIITAGYPCQPFSVAGSRNGKEDPRHLWPFIHQIVDAIRPICCFFENVPGHLTLGYQQVRQDLFEIGYKVEEGIFSAEEVGAPHQRKRLFIIALDNSYVKRWNDVKKGLIKASPDEKRHISIFGNEWKTEQCWAFKSGSEMANASGQRLQGGEFERPFSEQRTPAYGSITERRDLWPARPGQHQFEWEEPRLESSVGFTVNGYNYREDLLRMAGNAVVEQTAELAFRTLIKKF